MDTFLNSLRLYELDFVLGLLKRDQLVGLRLLEVGSGNGYILNRLRLMGVDAVGIDIATGPMFRGKHPDIIYYDGTNIPFGDCEFDVVFSSNCLEHIPHLDHFQLEISRVLKPDGMVIHVLPNQNWRLWTTLVHYLALPKRLFIKVFPKSQSSVDRFPAKRGSFAHILKAAIFYPRHGERGNRLTEYFLFRPSWWTSHFRRYNWHITGVYHIPIFYTDHTLCSFLTLRRRAFISAFLGSVSTCYVMRRAE